jgi:uncharacterized radical SAM protein YgiQ
MFLPTTHQELKERGWNSLDIIIVSGDSYIDSPYAGAAVIGRLLEKAGYRVGIIAQPDIRSDIDITRLGEPNLFWGITGGCTDSMVANTTALQKKRKSDDYTPGGINDRRPDRAVIAYTNLIKRWFKQTKPIVLGGIEASLRRVAHYDYWDNRIRSPILFDSKADLLLYGMADRSVLELALHLQNKTDYHHLRGLCYLAHEKIEGYIELPSYESVVQDKRTFIEMFHTFYLNQDPITAQGLCQQKGDRYLVHNPPQPILSQDELDAVYALEYQRAQHPYYEKQGKVKALETIQFSIATHRGCYGECNFCAIAVHEGRTVQWRSEKSVLAEAELLASTPEFKGIIQDIGGPTANMYGFECGKKLKKGACPDKRCLYPIVCPVLKVDHSRQIRLLRKIRQIPGVKKAFIASGIRYDMVFEDDEYGNGYLMDVVAHHVSGQLKVAPEHTEDRVLDKMGKPGQDALLKFKRTFDEISRDAGKKQFLTYYLIAAHPGCTESDMKKMKRFVSQNLKIKPEQVQIFTPTPSTYSSLMYYTEIDPFTGEELFVEKALLQKQKQKDIVTL